MCRVGGRIPLLSPWGIVWRRRIEAAMVGEGLGRERCQGRSLRHRKDIEEGEKG